MKNNIKLLDNIKIILCNPSHPGNIGSVARAMKNMGIYDLNIINPNLMKTPLTPNPPIFDFKNPKQFILPKECFTLASNAKDIIENTKIYTNLNESLVNVHLAYASSSRKRELTLDAQNPREASDEIIGAIKNYNAKIAIVFGSETFGLSIEELTSCNRLITINTNQEYSSLNLAQAVQIITYEIFTNFINFENLKTNIIDDKIASQLITNGQLNGLIEHFIITMDKVDFLKNKNKDRLIRRIYKIFHKANLEQHEVDILRGFLKSIDKKLTKND